MAASTTTTTTTTTNTAVRPSAPVSAGSKTSSSRASSNIAARHEKANEPISDHNPEQDIDKVNNNDDDDANTNEEFTPQYVEGFQLVAATAGLSMCTFLMMLDNSILATAVPTITNEFNSVADIGWYISAYQLALSVFQPISGKFFTYFSNKRAYSTLFILFELGSLICALANSSRMLIGGRVISGVGGAGLFTGGLVIISAAAPGHRRPFLLGIVMGIAQLGLLAGPLIGGALTQYTTWRWCFYINLPIGAVALLLVAIVKIPEQMHKPKLMVVLKDRHLVKKFDLVGMVFLVPAVVMLLLALQFGGVSYPWKSATVIGLFCGFGAMTAVFLAWESYTGDANAMLPLGLFKRRIIMSASVTGSAFFASSMVQAYYVPVFFQAVLGATPFFGGVDLLPMIISQLIITIVSGALVTKLGYYLPWAVASGALTTIASGLISTWSPSTPRAKWIGYQVLAGAGRGAGMQMPLVALQNNLPPSAVAQGTAIILFLQCLLSSIMTAVSSTILDTSLITEIPKHAPGTNADVIIQAGATSFRSIVTPEQLPGILDAYAIAFDNIMYVSLALGVVVFFASFGLGWVDVRQKKGQMTGAQMPGEPAGADGAEASEKVLPDAV